MTSGIFNQSFVTSVLPWRQKQWNVSDVFLEITRSESTYTNYDSIHMTVCIYTYSWLMVLWVLQKERVVVLGVM